MFVDVIERAGNILYDVAGFDKRERAAPDTRAQCAALHIRHHDEIVGKVIQLARAVVIYWDKMVFPPGSHQLRLAHEAPQHLLIFTLEDFYRDDAPRRLIDRLVYISHAPFTNQSPQFIAVEGLSLQFCHAKLSLLPSAVTLSIAYYTGSSSSGRICERLSLSLSTSERLKNTFLIPRLYFLIRPASAYRSSVLREIPRRAQASSGVRYSSLLWLVILTSLLLVD